MSLRFRFSKESLAQMKRFVSGKHSARQDAPIEASVEASAPPAPAQEPVEGPITIAARTDIGRVRSSNQDALVEGSMIWGVADGMGGHNGGETASAGARDGLLALLEGKNPSLEGLRTGIQAVNHRLFLQQKENEKLAGMGTTLTLLWFSDHFVYIGHVGDSRAYLLRDGEFRQITDDHSLVAELVRAGHLTSEQAEKHPMRNVITRAVGTEESIEVDLIVEERKAGDVWLICSDGLYGQVDDHSLEAILTLNDPETAAGLMLDAALAAGGPDNISLIILHDKEGGE